MFNGHRYLTPGALHVTSDHRLVGCIPFPPAHAVGLQWGFPLAASIKLHLLPGSRPRALLRSSQFPDPVRLDGPKQVSKHYYRKRPLFRRDDWTVCGRMQRLAEMWGISHSETFIVAGRCWSLQHMTTFHYSQPVLVLRVARIIHISSLLSAPATNR